MYICICTSMTRQEIKKAILDGEEVEAGTKCGNCLDYIYEIIEEMNKEIFRHDNN